MKSLKRLSILLLSFFIISCQQPTTREESVEEVVNQDEAVAEVVDALYKGIVEADQAQLEAITADDLIYGHSNGRVQNKSEFIAEIIDPAALDFLSIDLTDQTINVTGETAVVRHVFFTETSSEGSTGSLSIGIMLVLQKQNGAWKVLARQAYRLPE